MPAVRIFCPHCSASQTIDDAPGDATPRCRRCRRVLITNASRAPGMEASEPAIQAAIDDPFPPDTEFGRYRIIRKLGEGGMGAVYLAHDSELDRRVALKVPTLVSGPAGAPIIERFCREARTAARLDHPQLCPVYDVGKIGATYYLTMPYIEGKPLSEVINPEKRYSQRSVAVTIRKIALAMEEAHRRGIVHRDLKPSNIMVRNRSELIVMDFGLARSFDQTDAGITQHGGVLGTPLYMAPEQLSGDPAQIGPGCDIYSLGVIFYEILTGRRPFEGPPNVVIGLLGFASVPPPSEFRPDIDAELGAICLKALAKSPSQRYPSMEALASALSDYEKRIGSSTTAEPGLDAQSSSTDRQDAPRRKKEGTETLFRGFINDLELPTPTPPPTRPSVRRPAPRQPTRRRPPRRIGLLGTLGAAAGVLLGVVFYVATNEGTIKIEINDASAQLRIDGGEISIENLGEPITLRVGRHELVVKRGDLVMKPREFTVYRGANPTLVVTLQPPGPPGGGNPGSGATNPTPDRANRDAAKWVLMNRGTMTVLVDGRQVEVRDATELPEPSFRIQSIRFGKATARDRIDDEGAECLAHLQDIEELDLRGTRLSDAALGHVAHAPRLARIDAGETSIGDAGLAHLRGLTAIEELRLDQTAVTDGGLLHLMELPRLRFLKLSGTRVTDLGLGFLTGSPALAELDLSQTAVTDDFLRSAAKLRGLNVLWLNETRVTDDGLAFLKDRPGMVKLSLAGTSAGDACIPTLESLTSLRDLDLTGARLTPEAMDRLRKALPNCRIVPGLPPGVVDARDRRAVEIARLVGAQIHVDADDTHLNLKADAGLPGDKVVRLREIACYTCPDMKLVDDRVAEAFVGLEHLGHIDIRGTAITSAAGKSFAGIPNLVSLQVSESAFGDDGLARLRGMKKLVTLWLHNTQVTDAGLVHLKELPSLKELLVSGTTITDRGVKFLCENLDLTDLELNKTGITDAALPSITRLANLKYLGLNETKVTEEGIRQLVANTQLERISLSGARIGDGVVKLIAGLPRLAILDVSGCRVGDELMGAASKVAGLKELNIASTAITDKGIDLLRDKSSLEVLNLGGLSIGPGAEAALKTLKNLRELNVLNARAPLKTLERIRDALPRCRIITDAPLRPAAGAKNDEKPDATASNPQLVPRDWSSGQETVTAAAFLADGRHAVTAGHPADLILWDVTTGKAVRTLEDHPDVVWAVAVSPDGRYAATGGQDHEKRTDYQVRLWDLRSGRLLGRLAGPTDTISGLAFSADGAFLTATSWDKSLRSWRVPDGTPSSVSTADDHLTSVAVSADGRRIATGTSHGNLLIWEAGSKEPTTVVKGDETSPPIDAVTFAGGSNRLVMAPTAREGEVGVLDLSPLKPLRSVACHTGRTYYVACSPDGRLTASGGKEDKSVRVWEAETGRELYRLLGFDSPVRAVAFSPDGRALLACGYQGKIRRASLQ